MAPKAAIKLTMFPWKIDENGSELRILAAMESVRGEDDEESNGEDLEWRTPRVAKTCRGVSQSVVGGVEEMR